MEAVFHWVALFVFDNQQSLTVYRPEFTNHRACLEFTQSYRWREYFEQSELKFDEPGALISIGCHRNDVNTAGLMAKAIGR